MACCQDETHCPMHATKPHGQTMRMHVSQVDADSCCASAERGSSTPSTEPYVTNITFAVFANAIPAVGPDVALFRESPSARISVDVSPVPKHLLHSVFLI